MAEPLILGETDEARMEATELSFLYPSASLEGPSLICGRCGSGDNFGWVIEDNCLFLVCLSCNTNSVGIDLSEFINDND